MNPEPTPSVFHADWSHEQVTQLLQDLADGAEIDHVQVRGSNESGTVDRRTTLDEARDLFLARQATAIQIRYRFDGQAWCDTLMVKPETVRVVRTKGSL